MVLSENFEREGASLLISLPLSRSPSLNISNRCCFVIVVDGGGGKGLLVFFFSKLFLRKFHLSLLFFCLWLCFV